MIRAPLIERTKRGLRGGAVRSSPAPVGGWNARDSLAAMPVKDAVWMENWFPSTSEVTQRKGAEYYLSGVPANVQTLMGYSPPLNASKKLFAATPTAIYEVTGGALSAVLMVISNGYFRYATCTTPAGTFLIAVNGVDTMKMYDGTTWNSITAVSPIAITGVLTSSLDSVTLFKRRLWFVERDSMNAWYLPVDQVGGAASKFPVGQLFKEGGRLVAIASWTLDAGDGSDDYLAMVTSEGEVAVYKGTDPSSATTWELVGVYLVGEPVGKKPFVKYGGDLLIITQMGLFPLSKALLSSTINRAQSVSAKIDIIFSMSASAYGGNQGWVGDVLPKENALVINVPTAEGFSSNQLVMNTITNAWCLFTGWDAFCWEVWDEELYFGGAGFVAKAFSGYSDFGENIVSYTKTAFNYFGSPMQKHFKLFRPLISTSGEVSVNLGVDVDFSDIDRSGAIDILNPLTFDWDVGLWDQATWGPDYAIRNEWYSADSYPGSCAALRLRIASKDVRVGWTSTDFVYLPGGVL